MEKRVVVTGMGVLSCTGNDVPSFWNNIVNGVCGIDYITEFPTEELSVRIGGKVRNFDPLEYGMDKAFARKQDPFTIYAVGSAWQAMRESGLVSGTNIDPYRLSVCFGSGVGGFQTIYRECAGMAATPSGEWVSPSFVPCMIGNMASAHISMKFNARGSCIDVVTACATSSHALGEAYRAIRHGYADAVIAGGSEASTIPIGIAAFANCKALTKAPDPKYASLPFNAQRGGFVLSDGAAAIVLEEYEHAVARGARIIAEMVGYGSTCDAYHVTAPRPEADTQAECIRQALSQASFDPSADNVYINAHGTGTRLNDVTETKAYKLAFGDFAYKCHISSSKSMHGHMLGATGAAEALVAIKALENGIVPPTINLDVSDPECDLDYTPCKAVRSDITLSLSDSFGFGGHNACLAFRKV